MSDSPVTAGDGSGSGDPLGPQVRRLFEALAHAGEPRTEIADSATGAAAAAAAAAATGDAAGVRVVYGDAGRELRGTRVKFMLRLAGEQLLEVRYRAYGCPYTLAACEWLARRLEAGGRHLIGLPGEWAQELSIPPARMGRLLVVEDALRAALAAADLSGADS
jgi:hypothetical protein